MTIYEIDQRIQCLFEAGDIDPDTGELLIDTEALDALQMERDTKIENLACYVKNLKAEADAIKSEESALKKRRDVVSNKAVRLQKYLEYSLAGQRFESPRATITFRETEATEVDDDVFLASERNRALDLITYTPSYSKTAIKQAIKSGEQVEGAQIVRRKSMTIK